MGHWDSKHYQKHLCENAFVKIDCKKWMKYKKRSSVNVSWVMQYLEVSTMQCMNFRESCEKGEDLCDASWNLCICEAEEKHVPVSPTRLLHRLPNPFIFTWSLFSLFTPPPSREHFANTLPSCIHQGLLNTTRRQYILISNALFVFERKNIRIVAFCPQIYLHGLSPCTKKQLHAYFHI